MKAAAERPVQVLQVLTRLGAGGPPLSVILLTRELNRRGISTRLVTGRCDHVDLDMSYLLNSGDPVDWVPEMSRSVSFRDDLVALWRLYRLMRRTRPAIVQTHTAKAGALGRIAARLAGVPVVIHTFHGHVLSGYFSPRVSLAIRVAERLLAQFTDAICVLAPQQARDLTDRFHVASPRQVRVIRLGLDLAPFQALDPPPVGGQCLTVGWLGRLVEVKDVPLLIRVIGETLRRNPQIRFVVAGDGTQRPLMESAARRWPDGRVQWLGWQEDAAAVIAQCDVLVQTSRSEGTPIALIQGMAAGRPFVSTPAGGVVDMVVGDSIRESAGARWFSNAVLVEPDPAAFASALSELQGNRELVRAMGCQAAAFANARHNLAAIVRDYDRLYSELLASLSTRAWDAVPPAVDEIAENLTPQLGQKGS